MRHRKTGRKLGRTNTHKKALMRTLASELIEHKRIHTTLAKAKELRPYAEKLITRAKKALAREQQGKLPEGSKIDVHSRREIYKNIRKKYVLEMLFDEVAPTLMDRNGGYTRIVKTGRRRGDGGETALIELVDWNTDQDSSFKRKKFNKPSTNSKTQTGIVDNTDKKVSKESEEVKEDAVVADNTDNTAADNDASNETQDTSSVSAESNESNEDETVSSSEIIEETTGEVDAEVSDAGNSEEADDIEPVGTANESDFSEVIAANDVNTEEKADPTPENNDKNDDDQESETKQN